MSRRSAGQRRVGRQHDDQLLLREQPADEPGFGDRELGEPDLGAAAPHQRCDGGGVLRLIDPHDDVGVGVAEDADQGRERVDGQRGQRHHVEGAGGEAADRRDRRAQDPEIAQHLPGRFEERLARRRQEGAPPDPVEQLEAQLGLETANPLRERRLRDVEGGGGSGEAALLDDPDHVLDLADLHRSSLWYLSERSVGLVDPSEVQSGHGASVEGLRGERRAGSRRGPDRRRGRALRRLVREGWLGDTRRRC